MTKGEKWGQGIIKKKVMIVDKRRGDTEQKKEILSWEREESGGQGGQGDRKGMYSTIKASRDT